MRPIRWRMCFGKAFLVLAVCRRFHNRSITPCKTLPRTLNEYLRFDQPGHYRLYVLSNRLSPIARPFGGPFHSTPAASQMIEFDILSGEDWAENRARQVIALLDAPIAKTSQQSYQAQERDGALLRELRFLDTPLSRRWLIAHFTDARFPYNGDMRFGLLGTGDKNDVVAALRAQITAPNSALSSPLFNVMQSLLFEQSAPPELLPYPNPAVKDSAALERYNAIRRERNARSNQIHNDLLRDLKGALPAKIGAARATTLQTLAEHQAADDSAQAREVRQQLLAVWDDLSREAQQSLLQNNWPLLRDAAMLPILEKALPTPPRPNLRSAADTDERNWRTLLLQRLLQLSPTTGRKYLLSEMQRPSPRVEIATLLDLPEQTLPALDETWLDNLRHRHEFYTDTIRVAQLVARYASPKIKTPLESWSRQNVFGGDAQTALLAYFVRVVPAHGVELVRAAQEKDKLARLSDIAAFVMNPELETLAIQTLNGANRTLAADAALALARAGTPRGAQALWQRLQDWHAHLQGQELTPEQAQFDTALAQAMASLPGVQNQHDGREKLRALALSEAARESLRETYFDKEGSAPLISYRRWSFGRGAWNFGMRNGNFRSLAELGRKLQQFPRGTTFRFRIDSGEAAPDSAAINARVQLWLHTHGYKVELDQRSLAHTLKAIF